MSILYELTNTALRRITDAIDKIILYCISIYAIISMRVLISL